ncbi:MAG: PAS/PAC sensor-containing diguanylate cyclase/phosphodiesterase [Comamonadaceae bacterium]|nr:MAG: PAS/PAC sensor-containing diguanylate cyclase/phosphodiesterase [Comamonadaceae bacterium]
MIDSQEWSSLCHRMPVAVSLSRESDGVYVDVSAEWLRLTGFSRSEVLGVSSVDLGMWPSQSRRSQVLAALRETGELRGLRVSFVKPDQTLLRLELNASRMEWHGEWHVLSYLKDLTGEQAAQIALLASEQLLKATNERLNQQLHLFESMESLASMGYWTSGSAPGSLVLSKGLYQLCGLAPDSVAADCDGRSRILAEDVPAFLAARETLDGEILHYRWQHPDGRVLSLRGRMQRLMGNTASEVHFGVVQDISRERETELALQDRLSFIEKITSRLPGVVFQIRRNAEGVLEFLYVSEPASQIFPGITAQAMVQDAYCILGLHHPDDVGEFKVSVCQALDSLTPWQHEYRLRLSDGQVRWLFGQGVPEPEAHGAVLMSGFVTDITERKLAEEKIEQLAFYDALTGLPNRRLLLDRLQLALLSAARSESISAVLFIDLDNFKDLNDTLGHDVGDMLLRQVAQRLQNSVREADTVARLGGDEFVVVLEDLGTEVPAVTVLAEKVGHKILDNLNHVYELNRHELHSTPSIGVALLSKQVKSVDELLKQADLAMYESKSAGRNTMRFFDPAMQALVAQRTAIDRELRQALKRAEWVLHYQPVVDEQAQMVGVEALVRWQHPRRGLLSPGEFIDQAEQSGLILPLGQWVLRQACEQLVQWADQPATAQLTMAVNVSARQFRHPEFVDQVLEVIRSTGAAAHLLKLEITESLLVTDMLEVIEKMQILRSAQVSFALDDFGTGYSSLSYLKRLPMDQLKIDQSFVRDVLTDTHDAAIAQTVLTLGQSLNLRVVAEGVETPGQWQFLAQRGCKLFQGYLFGKPVPVAQLPLASLSQPLVSSGLGSMA